MCIRDRDSPEELSQRESEILLHICRGESNSEIADSLFISKRTVDKHRSNILAKTGCKNTANPVSYTHLELPRGYPIHGHRLPVDIPVRFRIAEPFAMPVESWWMRRLSGEDVRVIGLILVSCIACRTAEFI